MLQICSELNDLLGNVFSSQLVGVFDLIEIAEQEIAREKSRCPQFIHLLDNSFMLLSKSRISLAEWATLNKELFRFHCRELLQRITTNPDKINDIILGTKAEVVIGLKSASMASPLIGDASKLYFDLLQEILGEEKMKKILEPFHGNEKFFPTYSSPDAFNELLLIGRKGTDCLLRKEYHPKVYQRETAEQGILL